MRLYFVLLVGILCPATNYHLFPNNSLAQRFWGRIDMKYAFAYLKYTKRGKAQKIIHSLKYEGVEEIGELMGKWYGNELKLQQFHKEFDLILPIPLHPNRKKQRGYNQSDSFAKGLSEILEVDWADDVLIRNTSSSTQTRKGRLDRWENVKEIFGLAQSKKVIGKRILLVDDVITTGATIEACARKIVNSGCESISVGAIATAY